MDHQYYRVEKTINRAGTAEWDVTDPRGKTIDVFSEEEEARDYAWLMNWARKQREEVGWTTTR